MTTYIESKLNPDGTYDHSEVIEACKKGSKVQAKSCYAPFDWFAVESRDFDRAYKYRAVIEDKQPLTEEDVEKMFTPVPAEVKLQIANSLWESAKPSVFLAAYLAEKFKENDDTITLTRAEVNEVFPGLLK